MDEFFPKGYEVPKVAGDFINLEKGENVFRIMARPTMGYEFWTEDNKPHRSYDYPETLPEDAKKNKQGEIIKPKHIWSVPVLVDGKDFKILSITQKTVQESIVSLSKDEDWGNPTQYDLKVVRDGDGLETKYTISPKPKKALDETIMASFREVEESMAKKISEQFS